MSAFETPAGRGPWPPLEDRDEATRPTASEQVAAYLEDAERAARVNGTPPPVVASTWAPVNLAPTIAGGSNIEPPSMLARSDGPGLLYPGRLHSFYSEPESAKTWVAAEAGKREINAGRHVLYFDFEGEEREIVARLRALGVSGARIAEFFHYIRPEEPIDDLAWTVLAPTFELEPRIAILEGLTDALTLHGCDLRDNTEVARFMRLLPRPLKERELCVLMTDHVIKDREARGRNPIGAQHKLAGVDVAYSLRVIKPFGRGRDGLVAVKVEKDRPGYVREHQAPGGQVAMLRLYSSDGGDVSVSLDPPEADDRGFRPTVLMERVSRAIEEDPGITKGGIRSAVKGNSDAKDLALNILIAEEFVNVEPDGQALRHRSARPYRDEGEGAE